MRISIQFLTRRTEDHVSVRTSEVDASVLRIGRGAGCEIHLPDLRVQLDHAELREEGGKLVFTAQGDKALRLNKKFTNRAVLGPKDAILIGPYEVKLAEAPEGFDYALTVEMVQPAVKTIDRYQDRKAFSVGRNLWGKRAASWVLFLLFLGGFLAVPVGYFYAGNRADPMAEGGFKPDRLWISGSMSASHKNLTDNCEACHINAFEPVPDNACVACHENTRHHAEVPRMMTAQAPATEPVDMLIAAGREFAGLEPQRCASCHKEHNPEIGVVPTPQGLCTDCHKEMDTRLTDTELKNAYDFGFDHPDFSPTVVTDPTKPTLQRIALSDEPIENSGLKFPHDIHMMPEKMAQWREDGLDCGDCHVLDPGGIGMMPINQIQHCQECHSLKFDPDAVDGEGNPRVLPHGQPYEIVAVLRDYYAAEAIRDLDRSQSVEGRPRRAPGRSLNQEERRAVLADAQKKADAKIEEVFTEGICYECHTVLRPAQAAEAGMAEEWTVVKPKIADIWLPKGYFHHLSHQDMACADCHEAESSSTAQDVMLPGIATCRDCHGGENAEVKIASTCIMCHKYHQPQRTDLMVQSVSSDGLQNRQWRESLTGE